MSNRGEFLELEMQELEAMDAPFWATAGGVLAGISTVSAVGSIIATIAT